MSTSTESIRTALLLPEDCTDAEVVAAVKTLLADYLALKRRIVEEGTDLYQELAKARQEISGLAAELRKLKNP
jgi:hypothetical protein